MTGPQLFLRILDILIPRFMDEEVALREVHDGYVIVCAVRDLEPGERADAIGDVNFFNFFGWALFTKPLGRSRPFINPHDTGGAPEKGR
jgi:hypothetical protein